MKRICVVTTSMSKGGAERFSALLSQLLSKASYDVHVLTTKNEIDFEYSGILFCLEKELRGSQSAFKKMRILRSYFKKNSFDIIIDNRTRPFFVKDYLIYKYIFKASKIISVVHSYSLNKYLPSSAFLAQILYKKTRLVAVSREIQNLIIEKYRLENCELIYNPVDLENIAISANKELKIKESYILFFGRIDEKVKNLNLLLKAYKESELADKGIKLYILGEGDDVSILKENIAQYQLKSHVRYIPYVSNPFPYVKNAVFTTLTSRHEGFPMSLIESLASNTPVVSVNCKSGPKELIEQGENGLLVENHNPKALAEAFNTMVIDKTLYKTCKNNAKKSVERFSIENITKDWSKLLNQLD